MINNNERAKKTGIPPSENAVLSDVQDIWSKDYFWAMSDYPKGGDIQTTRVWLDKEGFTGVFSGWKADAILGKPDEYIKAKFPQSTEGQGKAEILCGLLNTARTLQNSK